MFLKSLKFNDAFYILRHMLYIWTLKRMIYFAFVYVHESFTGLKYVLIPANHIRINFLYWIIKYGEDSRIVIPRRELMTCINCLTLFLHQISIIINCKYLFINAYTVIFWCQTCLLSILITSGSSLYTRITRSYYKLFT